ncbi:MAG: DUF1929 domain-containing protein [Myxococcales bacterium]|nr:DUF1929 domain-containing protein [Myxococcales bacterium]
MRFRFAPDRLVEGGLRAVHAVLLVAVTLGAGLVQGCGEREEGARRSEAEALGQHLEPRLELVDPGAALAVALPNVADPTLTGLVPPADAPLAGMWSQVHSWPLNGLHATLLPDGRVLTYGTPSGAPATQDGRTFDVWDPSLGFDAKSHRTTFDAQRVDSFCAGAAFLGDGSLLISGGNSPRDSSVFTPGAAEVASSPHRMASDRWYGTLITLPGGRALMLGGSAPYAALRAHENPGQAVNAGTVSMTPELYESGWGFRSLFGAYSREAFGPDHHRYWYPRAWVAPSGEVFGISSEKMWYLDPSGDGSVRIAGDFKGGVDAVARPNVGPTSTAVMFAPGRILQVGGNGYYDGHATPSSALATVIDITGDAPVLTETAAMSVGRQWANATVLPDGKVVVTGGTRSANRGGADAVYHAELWDPEEGTWTIGASASVVRVYHSAALLMPNGTVLSTGGGAPGPVNNLNAEVYYPPYLFRDSASGGVELAPRPRPIAVSTLSPGYGESLNVDLAQAAPLQRVALIGTSSVTHSFNSSQRRLELPFVQRGGRVAIGLPTRDVDAPPGYYLLFLLDAAGVPSPGILLSLGLSAEALPAVPTLLRGSELILESLSHPGSMLATDAESRGVLLHLGEEPTEEELSPARFIVRDGLADASCVSFESAAKPGWWLRHQDHRLRLDAAVDTDSFREEATFCVELGLAGSGLSFRSKNLPGRVIAHDGQELWLEPEDAVGASPEVATFTVRRPPLPTIPPIAAPIVTAGSTVTYTPTLSILGARYSWDFGDGTASPPESLAPVATHVFATPGVYLVTFSVRLADGRSVAKTFVQAVRGPLLGSRAASSSQLASSPEESGERLWVVDPDNDLLSGVDAASLELVAEVPVCSGPRSVAVHGDQMHGDQMHGDQEIWVTCRDDAEVAVLDAGTLSVLRTIQLPAASRPYGLVLSPEGDRAYVALDALGAVVELDTATGSVRRSFDVGPNPRGLALTADGARLLASRFISPPVPGEATATPETSSARGEVRVVALDAAGEARVIPLAHSDRVDGSVQGRGVPNYLGAPVVSPDGLTAWVPSKQDNVARGLARDGQALDFQNTVRAITSRIDLTTETEVLEARIDHDDAGLAAAAAFHPSGVYLFVALETSREVAVVNALDGVEAFRVDVGRAPQALITSADGRRLFVKNFMDRSVSVVDLGPLVDHGEFRAPVLATVSTVTRERLPADVLLGKQLFYDARDPRLARDRYISCATCHAEGGQDGRVWDLTAQGEGLRNTIGLVGRAGATRGLLHWSGNFDEVQDFERQIRALAGGTGLLSDELYGSGSISDPLGDPKAGASVELDALAAYVTSLDRATPSPHRAGGQPTAEGAAGREVFVASGCTACHYGASFSDEDRDVLHDIGTLTPASGQRLFGPLVGVAVPSLLDAWNTAPYLHDGSAATLAEAVAAHEGVTLSEVELQQVVAFLRELDDREPPLARLRCEGDAPDGAELGPACVGACDPCAEDPCIDDACVERPTCFDGLRNQDESDTDCGGGCPHCPMGHACQGPADCTSGHCAEGVCAEKPSCDDGTKNQDESDVDCGGVCAACPNGSSCGRPTDCRSGVCSTGEGPGRCQPAEPADPPGPTDPAEPTPDVLLGLESSAGSCACRSAGAPGGGGVRVIFPAALVGLLALGRRRERAPS